MRYDRQFYSELLGGTRRRLSFCDSFATREIKDKLAAKIQKITGRPPYDYMAAFAKRRNGKSTFGLKISRLAIEGDHHDVPRLSPRPVQGPIAPDSLRSSSRTPASSACPQADKVSKAAMRMRGALMATPGRFGVVPVGFDPSRSSFSVAYLDTIVRDPKPNSNPPPGSADSPDLCTRLAGTSLASARSPRKSTAPPAPASRSHQV